MTLQDTSGAPVQHTAHPDFHMLSFGERARQIIAHRFPEVDQEAVGLGISLTRAAHAHEVVSEQLIHRHDRRSWVQFRVLYVIWLFEPITGSDLARNLHLSRQTVSNTLRVMESDGLISRTRGEQDARVMTIRLTPHGRESLESALSAQFRLDEAFFEVLSLDEMQTLAGLLDRLRLRLARIHHDDDVDSSALRSLRSDETLVDQPD